MNDKKLVDEVIEHTGSIIGEPERQAVLRALESGRQYGYGSMIAWLDTAWAATLQEQDGINLPNGVRGHAYSRPPSR